MVKATPLLIIALGLAVCFRSNVWNIGAEGQFVIGAVVAGGVALLADKDTGRWIVVAIMLAGVLGGMAWAGITAFLRDKFNANEILVSLMLVYVAIAATQLHGVRAVEGPGGLQLPAEQDLRGRDADPPPDEGFAHEHRHPDRAGRAWRRCGSSCSAPAPALPSRWAGWPRRRRAMPASPRARPCGWRLLTSGGAAGLAGALEVAGPIGQLTPYVPAGYGFAAIIVAFVGRLHPVGMFFSAILMSMFYIGGELAQSRLGLPNSLTGVFQGLLLFSLLACDTLMAYRIRFVAPLALKGSN